MLRLFPRLLIVALGFLAFGGAVGFAQSGQISGRITDPQSAAIPGAAVQIVNQDRNFKRDTTTNNEGMYSASYLPPGRYEINVKKEGFSSGDREVPLAVGQALVLDIQMTVASSNTDVTVQAETSNQIELGTASLSTTMSNEEVAAYGLNGRNFAQLITMAPGVSNQTGQDEAKVGVAGSAKFSVNGGRVEYNTFEVDGSDVLNTSINASRGQGEPLMVYPSIDAIQEMKVLTGDYSALYGKSASGSVLVTTKSGGPSFHGDLYGFVRNEMFNARNYFDPVIPGPNGQPEKRTPLYRRQDYGGTIGGPLYIPHVYNTGKDKTFFFFSEELRLEKTPVDYSQAVPTTAERSGNFSDVCPVLIPGSTQGTLNIMRYPDCPHMLASSNLNQYVAASQVNVNYTSQALLNTGLIPAPNSVFGCDTTNPTTEPRCYVAAISPPTYWREELFRIDQVLTPNEQLDFRYVHDAWDTTTLAPQWGVVQNSFPTVENRLFGPGLDLVASLASVLPHSVLNRLTLSYAVEHISLTPQPGPGLSSLSRPGILDNPSAVLGNSIGDTNCGVATGPVQPNGKSQTVNECPMGYIFNNGFGGNKTPGLDFQGTNGAYGGHGFAADTGYAPWNQANPTYSIRDDLSKVWGRHTIQVGFEATYAQQNELSAVSGANSGDLQGLLTFSNQQSKYTSGNAFADFLAGPGLESQSQINSQSGTYGITAIKSYTQDSGQRKYYSRYKLAEVYLQDDFRVNSRLTLNLGLRASLFGNWYNPKDTAYNWLPANYNRSVGGSIFVDPNNGYLVNTFTGAPIPLNVAGQPSITNGLTQCGVNGVSNSCMSSSTFHPGPRFGFSWDPFGDGKMAIRGGYGLFWEHGTGYEANVGSLIGSAPLVLSETQSNPGGQVLQGMNAVVGSYNTIGYSCQDGATQCGSASTLGSTTYPLNVTSIPTKAVYPYTQQWSISVQRQVQKNLVAQLAYVGTKGTHLTAVRDLNQLEPVSSNPFLPGQPITASVCGAGALDNFFPTSITGITGSTSPGIGPSSPGWTNMVVACTGNPGFASGAGTLLGFSADAVRPYPGFSNIISVDNIANSSYHALQGTLREVTGPLTIGLAYTYSHSIDDSSDRSSANFTNSLDIRTNRGSSDFDQRHMLNVNYVYSLPLVRWIDGFNDLIGSDDSGGATAPQSSSGERIRKAVFDQWQISGITTYQTGTPFSVINGGSGNGTGPADNAGVGDGLGVGSYPDRIASPNGPKPYVSSSSNGSNVGPLLGNPGAFVAPQGLTFGSAGRNVMSNPTRINFNMALLKHFKAFHERSDVEFRTEAFNVFNHTQFRVYDPSHPGNTGNNVINCYGDISTGYSAGASGCLAGNSFLHPVDAHDPRILQFALKFGF
ncbi:carboxypeptidase regulatory-like domain-containing protein [Silvibacterium acidisoli]|uniref:carboxypeptidase regulatory-like domain-containing protein n=1 Tax=Acidobacteriaceae bacterium ZG23-2 TaxID=2883246 RepID=UPI00406BFF8C